MIKELPLPHADAALPHTIMLDLIMDQSSVTARMKADGAD